MNKFEKALAFISSRITPDSPFYAKIYLVGGCVRDELLGKRYSDLDLLIDMPDGQKMFVEHMCECYPDVCKGPFYYQRYGTTAMDIIIDQAFTLVECVEPHIERYDTDGKTLLETRFCTLEEDALRRDYTCNAIYKNLHTGEILDPTGMGQQDLSNGLLRTPLNPDIIYRQDPVRMLRGIRFKHQKGFRLDADAWKAIVKNHDEMQVSAPKRYRDELNKILKTKRVGEAIEDLYNCGLLPYVMPGLERMFEEKINTPSYLRPGITPWKHTLNTLHYLDTEYAHIDVTTRLMVLCLHYAESHGIEAAGSILRDSQIGKEKVGTIMQLWRMYFRFQNFFQNGKYVARPRALPHFIIGLGKTLDTFKRIVKALNIDFLEEKRLPVKLLSQDVSIPSTPQPREPMTEKERERERRHRKNVKRREQRKRAKARQRQSERESRISPTQQ